MSRPYLKISIRNNFQLLSLTKKTVNKKLKRLVEIENIEKASSATNIPMIAVIKDRPGQAKKEWLVMNFIKLNKFIFKRNFSIQNSEEMLFNDENETDKLIKEKINGYFISLDIISAVPSILPAKSDRLITAYSL